MNVLIVEHKPVIELSTRHLDLIKKIVPEAHITVADSKIKINKYIKAAEIIISGGLSEIPFEHVKHLKWVHLTSAGVDKLSDTLKTSDVLITNSSGVHPIPIAEHVFAFMLMFVRCIHKAYRVQIEEKRWMRNFNLYNVSELHGKTIGIVGHGRIGEEIARVARCFNMIVLSISRSNFTHSRFHQLLKKGDFLVNCLPATSETYHLFTLKEFRLMKKTAYFINIGRGTTVNEADLVKALKKETIAGAGLDVFEKEPLPKTSDLWKLNNVILTPHYAGWTPYYMDRVIDIFCENLKAFIKNKPMPNLVDKKRGY